MARREEDIFNQMYNTCKSDYSGQLWKSLAIDCNEAFVRKMNMILLEQGINPMGINAKDLMDMSLKAGLVTNSKIHQIRMIRNDIAHNGYELDKLDIAIIKATYLYLKPFFNKSKFRKGLFK